jgi:hypothetical protein
MLTRNATDGFINGWKAAHHAAQASWRAAHGGGNYAQVLLDNARPSDQADDGPPLPGNPNVPAWTDVYQSPAGFGWRSTFRASDAGVTYRRTVSSHEDGPIVETDWLDEETIP